MWTMMSFDCGDDGFLISVTFLTSRKCSYQWTRPRLSFPKTDFGSKVSIMVWFWRNAQVTGIYVSSRVMFLFVMMMMKDLAWRSFIWAPHPPPEKERHLSHIPFKWAAAWHPFCFLLSISPPGWQVHNKFHRVITGAFGLGMRQQWGGNIPPSPLYRGQHDTWHNA